MSTARELVGKIAEKLRAAKIFTLAELMLHLECSRSTVQRRLRQWGCLSSYNCNGRYYTLPETAAFDSRGLWRCRGAGFSRYGNLASTVTGLVRDSEAGLSAGELGGLLGMNAHSFISHFASHPRLSREKLGGRYIYFSADRARGEAQRAARNDSEAGVPVALSDAEAVLLLVELVRRPQTGSAELAVILRGQVPRITPDLIDGFLRSHGLEGKKGASDRFSN